MQNLKLKRAPYALLLLSLCSTLAIHGSGCEAQTGEPAPGSTPSPTPSCTPLSKAPAPFANATFTSGNTDFGAVIAQGSATQAVISVISEPASGTPVDFTAQLWNGTQWTSASMGQAISSANVPFQVLVGNEWVAVGTIQLSAGSQQTAVYWDQANATDYSTPNTFPGLPVNVYSQPLAITTSAVDQHVGVAVVDYTSGNQLYLMERQASGADSSWASDAIKVGGVPVVGLAQTLAYDSNNLPWLLVKTNGADPQSLFMIYRDATNTWHQLPTMSTPNFVGADGAYSAMLSGSNDQIVVVWTEKQSGSTATQYIADVFGAIVDTNTKTVSPPSSLGNNYTDSTTSASQTPGFQVLAAGSTDGKRGMVELWANVSHDLYYGAISQDLNGNSQFLALSPQTAKPILPPWIFYDQCGDIATGLYSGGSAPNYTSGASIQALIGF